MIEGNGYGKLFITECPLCGAERGEDYTHFSRHVREIHDAADVGLEDDRLRADGGETETVMVDPDKFRIPTIDELDAMRVAHGLSQKEFSRRAGVEAGRWNTILHQDIDPQTGTTRAFLEVLQETEPETTDDLASKRGPKPKPSTLTDGGDDSETVVVCPECDRASVQNNTTPGTATHRDDVDQYQCQACKETFDEPVERERRREGYIRSDSPARTLDDMDIGDLDEVLRS